MESVLEQKFLRQWLKLFPEDPPELQHEFHDTKKWRFDFWWPGAKLALEVQGYGPGHCSRDGMYKDANKNNSAVGRGISILYLTSRHLTDTQIEKSCNFVKYIVNQRYLLYGHKNKARR